MCVPKIHALLTLLKYLHCVLCVMPRSVDYNRCYWTSPYVNMEVLIIHQSQLNT